MKVLSYNIRYGGVGREHHLARVITHVAPDVVLLQEATRPEVVATLARSCAFDHHGAIRGHSLAYLSRHKLSHHAWHKTRLASRRYLEIVVDSPEVRLFGVHLSAVHSNVTEQRRVWELRSLLNGISRHAHGFHAILGDFNTLAPGQELEINRLPPRLRAIVWLTGRKIRWMAVRMMLDAGYVDAYRSLHDDVGSTFPAWDPHIRLDYAFLREPQMSRVRRCEVVLEAPHLRDASDHLPLLLELAV